MKSLISSRKRLVLIAGFLLALLIVLNFSTYVLYTRAKDYLDGELGERLQSIAVTVSHAVGGSAGDQLDADAVDATLHTLLHMIKTENLLSNIVILTLEGNTVVDLGGVSNVGELNPFIELDYSAVTLARSGLPAYTSLYRSGDIYMKSAYAPITSESAEIIGILGVEAGATYFDVLRELRSAIIVVDLTSLILTFILGIFFYRQSLSLDKAQAAIVRGENLATMGRMVAGIAHEIRNPLSIIKTSAERLEKKYDLNDEVVSYISEEVDKLDRILTGYLDFAKAGSYEFKPHSVQKIVRRCLLILEAEIKEKSVDVIEKAPASDVMIVGDDNRIQQALLNVLLNAIQAVESGGRVEISLDEKGGSATIVVKDNGPGINRKQIKDVTRPFYTTKKHGSGLGLSIVSNIVDEHRGSLRVTSAPGSGTEVSISFPTTTAG